MLFQTCCLDRIRFHPRNRTARDSRCCKSPPRNSILSFSPSAKPLKKPISQLLIPGLQQIERGAFPIVPGATVELVNRFGSKTNPSFCRTFCVWKGAVRFGSPGASKKKLLNSSMSSPDVMRIGNPAWNVTIPDHCQPSSSCPFQPLYFGAGNFPHVAEHKAMTCVVERRAIRRVEVDRIQRALEARRVVQRLAVGVSALELQSVREVLFDQHLQRVVVRLRNRVFAENVGEHRQSVHRATYAGRRNAIR